MLDLSVKLCLALTWLESSILFDSSGTLPAYVALVLFSLTLLLVRPTTHLFIYGDSPTPVALKKFTRERLKAAV